MIYLIQSTASQAIVVGPFVDDTDGKTAETGLTIANTDIRLWKGLTGGGSGVFANKNSGGATHVEDGYYSIVLDATDTSTLGVLIINISVAGALPVRHEFTVLPSTVYASLVLGSDYLQTDVVQVEGSDATDQINAACDAALTDYDPPTKAELDSGLAGLNDLSAAEVNAEVDTALSDYDPPTKAELDSGFAGLNDPSAASIASAVWSETTRTLTSFGTLVADIWSYATRTLSSFGTLVADVADQVWDEILSGHTVSGSTGEALDDAGASGDPWDTSLPGSYADGSAGHILGNLNVGQGSGSETVNQDYGGEDALAAIDGNGNYIDGVEIRAHLTTDYNNSVFSNVQGYTRTNSDGSWDNPLMLDPGSYVLVYEKDGKITTTQSLTVT